MRPEDFEIEKKLKPLRQKYLEMLEGRIEEIKAFVEHTKSGAVAPDIKSSITSVAHNLSGSGATYGFAAISEAARALEEKLNTPTTTVAEMGGKARILVEACTNARIGMALRKPQDQSVPAIANQGRGLPVVLCVDDDEAIQQLLPQLLHNDAEVIAARDGNEALKIIEQTPPDVLILDQNMPNLSGSQLLETLTQKKLKKRMSVIMLTANKKNSEVVDAFRSGAIDYVVKPFDPILFRTRIQALLNRSRQKVLIADDDAAIRDLLSSKFNSLGYPVLLVQDGESLMSVARKELPNVIILDRMMPGGDGLSLFRQLRADELTKAIPVLFLTAKRREEDIIEALNEGAQDYIVKPFNIDEVVARCVRFMGVKLNAQR